ncbi:MAG: DNA repair protein RecO [Thermoleophilia bacterium]|nr:DNA repair protein RecO [Thermoleophilia bacterium]
MAVVDTEAVVLRTIRFGEADVVLALLTPLGRIPAIAKGARRPRSRLGGRLQPGVRCRMSLVEGRGELATLRGASVLDAHAGLWVEGYRLRAASCVLEAALRVLPEREPGDAAYNLVVRALGLLAAAPPAAGPPRLDPLVLGAQAKLLVAAGLLPQLGSCVGCGAPGPLVGFSPRAGGACCPACAGPSGAERVDPAALAALAALVGRPLADAPGAVEPRAAGGVERLTGLVLREHLGVTLRSAAPL